MKTTRKLGFAFGAMAALGLFAASTLPSSAATPTCSHQLKVVQAELKKAPAGDKKSAATQHYNDAVAAHKKKDDKTCLSDLDAAAAALK
ncbi:MAG: hypothetical protein U1E53_03215 [Dongiaceae bacterium]